MSNPFQKDSKYAMDLHEMLVTKQICMEAEPGIIGKMFPNVVAGNYSASKIQGGVTRVKKEARNTLIALSRINAKVSEIDNEGKFEKRLIVFLMPLTSCVAVAIVVVVVIIKIGPDDDDLPRKFTT
jgi:hypothetical protein